MMSHEEIKLQLQDYLENLLDEDETKNIESHVVSCTECRKELSGLKELVLSIESLPELEPPVEITELVMTRVRTQAVSVPIREKIRKWVPIVGYAYLLGSILVVGLCYGIYWVYQTYVQTDLIDIFTRALVALSVGIGKGAQWLGELWMSVSLMLQNNLSMLTTMFIIETVVIIAGIAYWFVKKQKSTHYLFA